MGRPTEGWKLRLRRGFWHVRFTIGGRRCEPSTGYREHEKPQAAAAAADIVAAWRNRPHARRIVGRVVPDARSLLEAVRQWLAAESSLRDERTSETYAIYAGAHWADHFGSVEGITSESALTYREARLRRVSASSVSKELGALRAFVSYLGILVDIPKIPRRVTGARRATAWVGAQELSPDEAEAILARLPHDARQRYTFGYETSLRGETIDALEVPTHWATGARHVTIPRELDKARAGRPLPLTSRAIATLESRLACMWSQPCSPACGVLFGGNRWRKTLKAAGIAVLGEVRGRRLVPTDLRAGRITHWLEESANMPGVQALAGHSRATTTARYVRPSLRAAEAVISGPGFGAKRSAR